MTPGGNTRQTNGGNSGVKKGNTAFSGSQNQSETEKDSQKEEVK